MPYKDREVQNAYQREWYARNREQVIARVKRRKWEVYGGICLNCGGPTVGQSKGQAAKFCAKPDCARAQRSIDRK